MINSRSLLTLDKHFKVIVDRWLQACSDVGLDILVISTFRDSEYQDWLYASGRTRQGKIVTMAKGGESTHQQRKALDYCIMHGKKCDWDNTKDFTRAGLLAEALGLVWAGRWNGKMKELGHIESN